MAAMTCTLTTALSRARRWMKSTSATWSMTGSVSGMHDDGGDAAGRRGLARGLQRLAVLLAGLAGEHLHVDQAGAEHVALAVDRPARARARCAAGAPPRSAITPSLTSRPPGSSLPEAGSIRRALRKAVASVRSLLRVLAHHEATQWLGSWRAMRLQHRHAHRHAHLDLVADDAARVVGDGGGDLHAAVHGAGMHDQRIGLGARQLLVVEAEEVEVLAASRARRSPACARAAGAAS